MAERPGVSRLFTGVVVAFAVSMCAGCGNSVTDPDSDGSGGGDGSVTTECGTFTPEPNTDGVAPQDPASPDIVEACTDLCAELEVLGCFPTPEACLDDCRMQSCKVCPGSIAPLTRCRAEHFDAGACTCESGGAKCDLPMDCEDENGMTGACGG